MSYALSGDIERSSTTLDFERRIDGSSTSGAVLFYIFQRIHEYVRSSTSCNSGGSLGRSVRAVERLRRSDRKGLASDFYTVTERHQIKAISVGETFEY